MPNAEAAANPARPSRALTPSTLAAAAPAKALLGMACAGKAAPRSTTKNPTMPAMTAMMVATIHVLVMKLENMIPPAPVGILNPWSDGAGPSRS